MIPKRPRIETLEKITFRDGEEEQLAVVTFEVHGLDDPVSHACIVPILVEITVPAQDRTADQLLFEAGQSFYGRIRDLCLGYETDGAWVRSRDF